MQIGFDQSAMTQDVDIASFERLSLALDDTVEQDLIEVFDELEFAPVPSLVQQQVWRWMQTKRQTLVEFLTPSFSDEEGLRPLEAPGVSALSLHYLNYLLAEPLRVPFLYRGGVLVQVPRPERYAIHKLIVADRQLNGPNARKSEKDRLQAALLIDALARDRPEDLADAYQTAVNRGRAWRQRLARSLGRMLSSRDILMSLDRV